MEDLSDIFQPIIDFVLGNIGIVIFALFLLSGFIGRGNRDQEREAPEQPQRQQPRPQSRSAGQTDERPLAERMAEYFGVEIPEEQQSQPRSQPQSRGFDRPEGRRSTIRRNVQDNYPELFGGSGMFDRKADEEESTQWGFDETEWGSTFVRNEEQWGNTFPERKSSEPRIEWPN